MVERIKILFGVNTFGGSRNIALDGGNDAPTARGGGVLCVVDPLHISAIG